MAAAIASSAVPRGRRSLGSGSISNVRLPHRDYQVAVDGRNIVFSGAVLGTCLIIRGSCTSASSSQASKQTTLCWWLGSEGKIVAVRSSALMCIIGSSNFESVQLLALASSAWMAQGS
jgi:hypothetical protein